MARRAAADRSELRVIRRLLNPAMRQWAQRAGRREHPTEQDHPRILLALTDPFSSVLIRGQAGALAAAGAEVTLVTSPGESAQTLAADEGAAYVAVSMRREIAPLADVKASVALIRVLRKVRPDLVIAGTPKAALLVLAAAAATRVPGRVFSLLGLRSATLPGAKGALVRAAERASARMATDVLCVSHSLRKEAVAASIVDPDRTHVVAAGSLNGVDLERYQSGPGQLEAAREFRRSLGCNDDDRLVGFVGRLTRDKGMVELAAAWPLVRDEKTRLVLIGPDEHEPECEYALRTLRSDPSVRFTGPLTDLPSVYAALDVLLLPTLREGLGNVLIEASAMSTAVVASRVAGCTDAVIDGTTGTLVPPRDPVALAQAVQGYLSDPDLRAAHGAAGRRRVELLFDGREVRRGQLKFYDEILRRCGRRGLQLHEYSEPASALARVRQ